ncbi:hypothetical protein [Bradyrhizobium sp. BRP56]|uniref:hypothetical protein n=1 Tax=Bradyrhizobium sp. BRP56 TaxID=2793819 RepID=UPI001CD24AFE|nr:hypothetical protein [Bradyrhizobium sp. BRP56]MCA1399350.1 hypothetical protein [Bradyrhizobium sp. BRP56]
MGISEQAIDLVDPGMRPCYLRDMFRSLPPELVTGGVERIGEFFSFSFSFSFSFRLSGPPIDWR